MNIGFLRHAEVDSHDTYSLVPSRLSTHPMFCSKLRKYVSVVQPHQAGIALLGSGIFIREEHLPAVLACSSLTLKAIYSRSHKSAQALTSSLPSNHKDVSSYSDDGSENLDALLARTDVQAVIIALPIANQAQYVRKSLQAGKHVLSEKPVAENVAEAVQLLSWYKQSILPDGVFWSVAENVRFWETALRAGEVRKDLGRALTFRYKRAALVEAGGKYFETEWRKVATHQGGFLLDGGVHDVAALRLILGRDDPLINLNAIATQLQQHLAPVDTIEAVVRTKSGAVGSVSISFGSTMKPGSECTVACEKGLVARERDGVVLNGEKETVQDEGSGVAPEVRRWAECILQKTQDPRQRPEEALADLEVIEACLRSGENGGQLIQLKYQNV
ncbi:hypothetical protein BT93_L5260 [Corymbia citriodora subsp. variegata]|uniref:Oxidoreductase n=1 Tax=Corymbia citriodora subsp. variegata TaxID=360336 RepID=A0A8T0CJF4_CORYI|nr:hypothetical protein BT93_L5260 [Corymbia citriodora subsp. variegata]